ncbi:MAG: UvrD-helicase domain-containing protein [Brevibacterium yomogidense]
MTQEQSPGSPVHQYSARALAQLLEVDPPTDEQCLIIESPHDESAAVIAGAGSGKTAVISLRVVWLVANGLVPAERILGLTFTRKAVGELNHRVRDYLARYRRAIRKQGADGARGTAAAADHGSSQGAAAAGAQVETLPGLDLPTVSTYNSYAAALVGDHGMGIGLEGDEGVIDAAARQELIDGVLDAATRDDVLGNPRSSMSTWVSGLLSEMGDHLVDFAAIDAHLDACLDALCTSDYLRGLADKMSRKRSGIYRDKAAKAEFVQEATGLADEYDAADRGDRAEIRTRMRAVLEAHDDNPVPKLQAKKRLVELARRYAAAKQDTGGLEFSDQVALAHRIMTDSPQSLAAEQSRWDIVLLDEFQDTSYAQFLMLQQIFGRHTVMAVGDPRQAIYGWRGASADNIESFPGAFRGPHDRPAQKYGLTISWRNDAAILTAANRIAAGLPTRDERVGLQPRPGAGDGAVEVSLTHSALTDPDRPDEPTQLQELVAWILRVREQLFARHEEREAARREAAAEAGLRPERAAPLPTFAVLCRARSGFGAIAAALQAEDLPVDVVGSRGLLDDPFVADALAVLEALVDPDAGDVLMRLLSGRTIRLGAADLTAFSSFVRACAVEVPDPAEHDGSRLERVSAVEGLDELLNVDPDGPNATSDQVRGIRSLTAEGRRRLMSLARTLRRLRHSDLALPGLVRAVIREAGIDTEVAALAPDYADLHTRALDGFLSLVSRFAGEQPAGGPSDFLRWARVLEEADELDDVPVDPVPGAITIMTVHASKGLEFDAVAVPFMHDEGLPSKRRPSDGWLSQGGLPYALRGDRAGLPSFDLRTMDLQGPNDLDARLTGGGPLETQLDDHHHAAERRLAYVALTRARAHLFVSASRFTLTRKRPVDARPFLDEVAQELAVDLPELPEADELDVSRGEEALWPTRDPAEVVARRAELLRVVSAAAGERPTLDDVAESAADPLVRALARRATQLMADAEGGNEERILPARVSTTALVGLRADEDEWWKGMRRPMPEPPSTSADLGTAFHAWVEQHFGQAALLEIEPESSAVRAIPALRERLETLRETFLASPYADRAPEAVELSFELVLSKHSGGHGGGHSSSHSGPSGDQDVEPDGGRRPSALHVPGKIDAVFREDDGGLLVVDWKTGRLPRDPARLDAMAVQLAMYRLALLRMPRFSDVPRVDAEFYFVGSDESWRPQSLPEEDEIVTWMIGTERHPSR